MVGGRLRRRRRGPVRRPARQRGRVPLQCLRCEGIRGGEVPAHGPGGLRDRAVVQSARNEDVLQAFVLPAGRSEEHTSELQSLMRISYAVFCLKKKNNTKII